MQPSTWATASELSPTVLSVGGPLWTRHYDRVMPDDASASRGVGARLVEAVVPSRMGSRFRWLLASEWANNLGDGIALSAGPLLIASQTRNPTLVALAVLLQRAPWFLFGLYGGWIADRFNRTRVVALADVFRAIVLIGLVAIIVGDQINVALVLVAMFLIGSAEVFADSATGALMPMLVAPADLGVANARVTFGRKALNELAGPPLGVALFLAGMAAPFVLQAVLVALGAVLITRIGASTPAEVTATAGIRADVMHGVHWLWANPPIRTLTLTVVLFNVTFGAMWPMLVLYVPDVLGLSDWWYGALLSSAAVGGLLGASSYGWLEQHASFGTLMRISLGYEAFMHLGLALSRAGWISMAIVFGFGFQASIWGTISTSVRQRAVPEDLQGRVASVYLVGVFGGMVLGNGVGAVLSGIWGVLAPFWFGFIGSTILLAIIWSKLPRIEHADELAGTQNESESSADRNDGVQYS